MWGRDFVLEIIGDDNLKKPQEPAASESGVVYTQAHRDAETNRRLKAGGNLLAIDLNYDY